MKEKIKKIWTTKEIKEIKKRIESKTKKEIEKEIEEIKNQIKIIRESIKKSLDYFDGEEIIEIRNRKNGSNFLNGFEELNNTFFKKYRPKGQWTNSKMGLGLTKIFHLKILECHKVIFSKIVTQLKTEDNFEGLLSFLLNDENEEFNDLIECFILD